MELLRHTHAHFGQIFMLYPGPGVRQSMRCSMKPPPRAPLTEVTDEYGAVHRVWKIAGGGAHSGADAR